MNLPKCYGSLLATENHRTNSVWNHHSTAEDQKTKNVIVIKHPWRSLFMAKLWPKALQVFSWIVIKFVLRITRFLNNCGWLPLIYIKLKTPLTSVKSLVVVPHNVAVFSIKTTFPLNWLMHIFVPSNALALNV